MMMSIPADRDPRWHALKTRDRTTRFFYSVKTTGVYCRPCCAARPRPENVAFHATRAEAEGAGFRACKRCKPDRETEMISFATAPCALGHVLVAASETGVCAILLGDDPKALARDVRERFLEATTAEDARLTAWIAKVARFITATRGELDVPLDPRGTAFQQRVWGALRAIPAGRTASYAAIAACIGAPRSVRAVAQACGANPLAVAIPCHRVVGGDGGIAGYRWGVARKRALLAREAA